MHSQEVACGNLSSHQWCEILSSPFDSYEALSKQKLLPVKNIFNNVTFAIINTRFILKWELCAWSLTSQNSFFFLIGCIPMTKLQWARTLRWGVFCGMHPKYWIISYHNRCILSWCCLACPNKSVSEMATEAPELPEETNVPVTNSLSILIRKSVYASEE